MEAGTDNEKHQKGENELCFFHIYLTACSKSVVLQICSD